MSGRRGQRHRGEVDAFRDWCRKVVSDPRIRLAVEAHALADPDYALKLAEHGYGKPPQALDIRTNPPTVFAFTLPGGASLPAESTGLPVPAFDEHGEG